MFDVHDVTTLIKFDQNLYRSLQHVHIFLNEKAFWIVKVIRLN